MVSFESGHGLPEVLSQVVSSVFSERRLHSIRMLEDGKTNSNIQFQVENFDGSFVFRRYLRGAEACRKEATLLRKLRNVVPVPELIDADITGHKTGTIYLLYRYVPGKTFREIRSLGISQDMADAAYATGRCISELGSFDASCFADDGLLQRSGIGLDDFDSVVLQERLDRNDCHLLERMHSEWFHVLRDLANASSLNHGDFNHRNIVLRRTRETWEVAGILDWELAGIGSFLSDSARFMCYERPDSKYWEGAFVAGLRAESASVPANWGDLSRVLNTLSAARGLCDRSTQERFIPELRTIVHCGLRGERMS